MKLASRTPAESFLEIVGRWNAGESLDDAAFEAIAFELFAYQFERNDAYRRFALTHGVDLARPPRTLLEIPAVPASAFKDATLATFDVRLAECEFHTSGTTAERSGKHYVERARVYDASLTAGFDRFMLNDGARLRYLNVVPNPRYRKHSSLGYMMGQIGVLRGDGKAAYFLDGDDVDAAGFAAALQAAIAEERAVCIAGTAFGLVALLDALAETGTRFNAAPGSRVMETGGFKGRSRVVARDELYANLEQTFGIAQHAIVAEYGMTELVSQYYDSPASRSAAVRVKVAPPWLRTLVVDDAGREVPPGETGFLRHLDLGNVSSVLAVETEDRGYRSGDGIVLLGRALEAPARGCSLDAEELLARR